MSCVFVHGTILNMISSLCIGFSGFKMFQSVFCLVFVYIPTNHLPLERNMIFLPFTSRELWPPVVKKSSRLKKSNPGAHIWSDTFETVKVWSGGFFLRKTWGVLSCCKSGGVYCRICKYIADFPN